MRALAVAALVLVTLAAGATPAVACSSGGVLVRPGVGIGKVQLGMSLAQARAAVGGRLLLARDRPPADGIEFREYATPDGLLEIAILGPAGNERVARIVSTGTSTTRKGVGVGTDVAAVGKGLLPLESECRVTAVFLNYRLHDRRTTDCAIVDAEVVTIFSGRAECAVIPPRYQGCPRIRLPVAAVAVESLALRRYDLSGWPRVHRSVGLVAREAGEGGRVAVPAGAGAKFRARR
jgi:hypothetical protein